MYLFFLFAKFFLAPVFSCNSEVVNNSNWDSEKVLFVSLGPSCGPALISHYCRLRKTAFPLDQIYSMDGEKLIELIKNEFKDFLNLKYMKIQEDFHDKKLNYMINTRYHIQFIHDVFDFDKQEEGLKKFIETFTRRVNRFKNLNNFKGKVYFMRAAFTVLDDPYAVKGWIFPEKVEVSEEYSLRLFKALKNFFPKLNFSLLIMNHSDSRSIKIEKKLSENIIKVRGITWPHAPFFELAPIYSVLFNDLMNGELD